MNLKLKFSLLCFTIYLVATALQTDSVSAQDITIDGTTETTVTADGDNYTIQNGTRNDGNLFHSFQDFSVPNGGEAFFDNASDVANILSRVTGGNISNIDGLIRANGNANLFLINPAGIIFGSGASLNIGGSFYGSTADSILFEDGEFSAVDNLGEPILTINAPIGLGIRDNPGNIVTTSDPTGQSFANLTVNSGQSVNLVGGNINLDRSFLNAPGGTIELGGLAVRGEVEINDDGSLIFPEGLTKSDIILNNGTTVNVAADNGGSIKVTANNLEILGGSDILAGIVPGSQLAEAQAGDITINVTEKISLESEDLSDSSGIINTVGDFSPVGDLFTIGSSGNVTINTKILEGNGNFLIGSATNGEGNAGNVNIKATERVSLLGIEGEGNGIASIVAPSATGNGADITVTTPSLVLSNSSLATSSVGQGNAGNIFINAIDSISLSNVTQLQAASFGRGDAGNIVIDAENANISLEGENVLLGTVITSSELFSNPNIQLFLETFNIPRVSTGQGGDIIIRGRNLSATGGASLLTTTTGQSTTERLANAGNIEIDVSESVIFSSGSQLRSETFGQGNAGNVSITAGNEVSFDGENNQGVSGIFNNVGQLPEFLADNFSQLRQGGNINITASSFSLSSGADLNSSTSGAGNSGEVRITADGAVTLSEPGTTIFSNVEAGGRGNSMGVFIDAQSLDVTDGAQIQTLVRGASGETTAGQGNAGDININVRDGVNFAGSGFSEAEERILPSLFSSVLSQGATGSAGNIIITGDSLSISDGARLSTASSGNGDAGNISLSISNSINIDGTTPGRQISSGIFNTVRSGAIGNGGKVEVTTTNLSIANGAEINAGTFGEGDGGTILVNASESVTLDGITPDGQFVSEISSSVSEDAIGQGGSIEVTTSNLSILNDAGIFANTVGEGNGGSITFNVSDVLTLRENSTISTEASETNFNGGDIIINAEDGFIVAFPNKNEGNGNDIVTRSPAGQGGDIVINAQGLFGLVERSAIDGNGTNDIDASGTVSGNVEINVLNSDAIEGANQLPSNPVETKETIAQVCSADRDTAGNNLTVIGRGNLPNEPSEPLNSETININGETASGKSPHPELVQPILIGQGDITPAQGVEITADGEIILTAYKTDNSSRNPKIPTNCNQS